MFRKSIIPLVVVSFSLTACWHSSSGGSSNLSSGSSTSGSGSSAGGASSGSGSSTGGSTSSGSGSGSSGGSTAGSGSSSGGSTMAGNGSCVTVPRPTAGQKFKIRTKNLGAGAGTIDVETTIKVFSATTMESDTVSTGDVSATGSKTNTYTIANNFIDTTKIVSKDTSTINTQIGAITTATDTTIDFSPFVRHAIDQVCENQTWTTTYDLTTAVKVSGVNTSTASNHSIIYTVEALNVAKTVTAGSFNTYQVKIEDGSSVVTNWLDIATGVFVKGESRDNTGTLTGTQELISQ